MRSSALTLIDDDAWAEMDAMGRREIFAESSILVLGPNSKGKGEDHPVAGFGNPFSLEHERGSNSHRSRWIGDIVDVNQVRQVHGASQLKTFTSSASLT